MKIRNGFVSNSSSSSFIVNLGKRVKTKDELAEVLGECNPRRVSTKFVTIDDVVDYVWNNLTWVDESPNAIFTMNDVEIDDFSISEYLFRDIISDYVNRSWGEDRQTIAELKKNLIEALDKRLTTKGDYSTYIELDISDCTDFGSALEQGEIFRNCKSVNRISHH